MLWLPPIDNPLTVMIYSISVLTSAKRSIKETDTPAEGLIVSDRRSLARYPKELNLKPVRLRDLLVDRCNAAFHEVGRLNQKLNGLLAYQSWLQVYM